MYIPLWIIVPWTILKIADVVITILNREGE